MDQGRKATKRAEGAEGAEGQPRGVTGLREASKTGELRRLKGLLQQKP